MMTVTLELPDDLAEKLLHRADKNNFATAALRGALTENGEAQQSATPEELDALLEEFDAYMGENRPTLPPRDLSRAAIYEDHS